MERLDKILVSQNFGSRKEVAALIRKGEVTVNGIVVKKSDSKIEPNTAVIMVSNQQVQFAYHQYYMMNKPAGVVSAVTDIRDETVFSLLPQQLLRPNLFPAGRLDKDTEGLLILTTDGDFAHKMLSPKKQIYKIYEAIISAPITKEDEMAFQAGIQLTDFKTLPATVTVIENSETPKVHVRICEGKFHQVKRMFGAREKQVLYLKRIQMGGLILDPSLPIGHTRSLTDREKEQIFEKDEQQVEK